MLALAAPQAAAAPVVRNVQVYGERLGVVINAPTTAELARQLGRNGYDLGEVTRSGRMPPLFVTTLPRDMSTAVSTRERKPLFIGVALPLVLVVNERVLADRRRIQALRAWRARGETLDAADALWLAGAFERYRAAEGDFDALLLRADIVPPSLAVAQGAEESGWGTSRFAHGCGALFGQRVYKSRNGMVPLRRRPGENFRIRCFEGLIEAVHHYVANLNTHAAYTAFRERRAALRRAGRPLTGLALVDTLTLYSERRRAYVKTLRGLMTHNRLVALDNVRFEDAPARPASLPQR